MKLNPQALERLAQADARFNRFDERFKTFLQQLSFFNEPRCPIKGIAVEVAPDERGFSAKYRTITIAFRMLFQLSAQGTPSARVECSLEEPKEGKNKVILGTFTFNPLGATNFEPGPDADPIDLEGMAAEILLHFIQLALEHGAA